MKKLSLILGAVVLGFIITSCGNNKKEAIMKLNSDFFNNEMTLLNAVDNADAMLDYLNASEARKDEFYTMMDEKYPINTDDELIGLSKADSKEAMDAYDDMLMSWHNLMETKGGEFYEPYLAKLEELVYGLADNLLGNVEPAEDITDQILAAYENTDKYVQMCTDEQYERYNEVDELARTIYGLDEDEEEEK